MKKSCLIFAFLFSSLLSVTAQHKFILFNVETLGGFTSPGETPFWLRSNQFGSIPLDNASLSLIGSVHKDYDTTKTCLIDWGASFEGRVNIGYNTNFTLIEGFGKLRVSIFEIRAGRAKEMMGLCDTTLSSGSFAVSGNALGIPKIQISIPEFYSIPLCGNLFAFKGNYTHGWIGKTSMSYGHVDQAKTYFHQKSLYGRFGKPSWRLKLYGGFNHQAFWGNEKSIFADSHELSVFRTYLYLISGKVYNHSKIGNHLGSIDLGFEYDFNNVRLFAYRQNFYDIGALYYLANIRDGLNGLSLLNKQYPSDNRFQWKKILLEVLYSKNQAGELWSPFTPSGDEDYYNNYLYIQGWSYKDIGMGTPFVCPRKLTRDGLPTDPGDYFINNRVVAFHFGLEGSVRRWNFIIKTSYSLNYGTFGTSKVGHTLRKKRTLPRYGIFSETKQLSTYFEASKEVKKGINLGFISAFDVGGLYYDSVGILISFSKSF